MDRFLMGDDNFFRDGAFFPGDDEAIDAMGLFGALVGYAESLSGAKGLQMIDLYAPHVVHFDVNLPGQMLEVECHLAVVGVGHYIEGP